MQKQYRRVLLRPDQLDHEGQLNPEGQLHLRGHLRRKNWNRLDQQCSGIFTH